MDRKTSFIVALFIVTQIFCDTVSCIGEKKLRERLESIEYDIRQIRNMQYQNKKTLEDSIKVSFIWQGDSVTISRLPVKVIFFGQVPNDSLKAIYGGAR